MANLILDIGNTRKKAAVVEDGKVLELHMLNEDAQQTIAAMCEQFSIKRAIASVVGRKPKWDELLPPKVLENLHILSHKSLLPITIDYETPQTLGMDRVAAVVGARQLCSEGPLVVVDAGSCITIDLLDDTNCYRGGAILPGIGMRFKAMHDYTAALPLVELSAEELDGSIDTPMTGRSTRASMVSGVCNAVVYEIEVFMRDYKCTFPGIKLFLTGGNADFFAKRLFFPNFATPNLMCIGLDRILEMNIVN